MVRCDLRCSGEKPLTLIQNNNGLRKVNQTLVRRGDLHSLARSFLHFKVFPVKSAVCKNDLKTPLLIVNISNSFFGLLLFRHNGNMRCAITIYPQICVDEHPRKRKSCLFILGIPDVNGVFIVWKIRYAWARRITCEVLTAPPNGFIGSLVLQEFIQQSISALPFVMIPANEAKQGWFFIWRWVPLWTAFMAGPVDWPCMEATMKKCDQGNCRKDCFQIDRKLGFHPDSDTFVSIYKTNLVGPLAWVSGFARRFVMLMGRGP